MYNLKARYLLKRMATIITLFMEQSVEQQEAEFTESKMQPFTSPQLKSRRFFSPCNALNVGGVKKRKLTPELFL